MALTHRLSNTGIQHTHTHTVYRLYASTIAWFFFFQFSLFRMNKLLGLSKKNVFCKYALNSEAAL